MNITQLKETIIANSEYIEDILEAIPLFKIKDFGKEYRCARYEDASATGVCVFKDNLKFIYRGRDGELSGDIITMIRDFCGISFVEAVDFICKAIGLSTEQFNKSEEVVMPFGGYYKGLKVNNGEYEKLPTYSEDILNDFWQVGNNRFLKDGINIKVQKEFGVCYDLESDRIVVPWRNEVGQIIGLMGRANYDDESKDFAKWFPILPYKFAKANALFGFSENYNYIQNQKTIIITESEKGVMQLRSMEHPIIDMETGEIKSYEGINLGVAVGSHSISNYQRRLIHSMFPDNIIIAFDEDVELDYLIETAKKMQYQSSLRKANIGYIFDKDNKYMKKGSKCSPTDMRKAIFEQLMKECLYFI